MANDKNAESTEAAKADRAFGRDEGGEDVRQVVWMGHTVRSPEGKDFFGAVGLTNNGYYRAAEVQIYGADEVWRWQGERHTVRQEAISNAEGASTNRLITVAEEHRGFQEVEGSKGTVTKHTEDVTMTELPEHVKSQADAEVAASGAQRMAAQDMGPSNATDWKDTAAMEASREQQRQNALDMRNAQPDPKQPDRA
jgi:hypothetical protein